jgi:TRAP-type C4-dicarboxylate transport system substrate-binding protein
MTMRRLILIALAVLLGGAAQAQQLKIATIAPENSSWVKGMRAGMAEIKERTDGRVTIKLFSGGIQGNDEAVLRKMRIGQLHGAAFTPNLLRKSYEDIVLYNLPMVFNDTDEVDYVRRRLDETLMQGLEEAGYVSFGFAGTGFSVILSDDPIRGVQDLRGKKIWAPEDDPISEAALKALGLNPVTLPLSDVYTGLQTKLIEIMPGSAQGAVLMQWYTKVNYFTDLPLVYTVGLLAIDKRAFDKLRPDDQQVVREVMSAFTAALDSESAAAEDGAKEAMINKGVERIVPDPAKIAEIREIVQASNRSMAEQGEFSLDLYEQLLGYIAEYRSGRAEDQAVAAAGAEGREGAGTAAGGQQ